MFRKIIDECSKLDIYQKRSITDEYLELVFYNRDIGKYNNVLTDVLGEPVKPQGIKPSKDDLLFTEHYGGIMKNQTLFKKDFSNITIAAMFWPWQDNEHTTLKAFILNK